MDELLNDFVAETRETAQAIAGEIVLWEADPADQARLDSIFRFIHTVKGSCGFLDLPRLERLSHAAEDALSAVRAGLRTPDARLVTAVLAIIDRIGMLVDAIETGESVSDRDDTALVQALSLMADPAAARPDAEQAAYPAPVRTMARSIRVPIDLLDRMMAGVSDLVLARNELSRGLRVSAEGSAVMAGFERLSGSIAEMRETITRTRMARVDQLFSALPRLIRDVSAELGKRVVLHIEGGDVELDREMIEMVRDPLIHIVRNAVDHGIEPPADRVLAGKPAAGAVRVAARQSGNQILIEISDDGRGIDPDALLRKAVAAGVVSQAAAARMDRDAALALIFRAGFSTAEQVSTVSGRGVGMDVVHANVERIGGQVTIDSQPGQGLHIILRVPMTLTIIPALTVSVAGQPFAIPRSVIEEILRVSAASVRIERGCGLTTVSIRGERLPLVGLAETLAGGAAGGAAGGGAGDCDPPILVVLRPGNGGRYVLGVDAAHDHEELVVKPAAPAIMAIGIYGGVTMPDDNRPMLLLDAAGIAARTGIDIATAPAPIVAEAAVPTIPTLLFRDLDGAERAIRLGAIERIEEVAGSDCTLIAGQLRLNRDGVVVPLLSMTGSVADRPKLRVLRISDGTERLAYAIDQVIDIVDLAEAVAPAPDPGLVCGVVMVADRLVELVDPYWMFAAVARAQVPAGVRPLALLVAREDGWMRAFLRPIVEAAGYRVAFAGEDGATTARATVVIADGSLPDAGGGDAVRLRLRHAATGDADIWRYDRQALVRALDAARGGAR
ncbi:hybrid sensor histidine kinase/response regulator [Sphingomonas montana]|uniref:hybrid sensor histidine kinase/response regulator n=1 Tax=Sphingomonas montana TaxID=1843236 RepID=UPI00096FE762|nr:ATP-binding protein [Sphingomonas montana]